MFVWVFVVLCLVCLLFCILFVLANCVDCGYCVAGDFVIVCSLFNSVGIFIYFLMLCACLCVA